MLKFAVPEKNGNTNGSTHITVTEGLLRGFIALCAAAAQTGSTEFNAKPLERGPRQRYTLYSDQNGGKRARRNFCLELGYRGPNHSVAAFSLHPRWRPEDLMALHKKLGTGAELNGYTPLRAELTEALELLTHKEEAQALLHELA